MTTPTTTRATTPAAALSHAALLIDRSTRRLTRLSSEQADRVARLSAELSALLNGGGK